MKGEVMRNPLRCIVCSGLVCMVLFTVCMDSSPASEVDSLVRDIEKLAAANESSSEEFDSSLLERVESAPQAAIADAFVPRLVDPKATEKQLAIYAWVLGVARDPRSVDPLIFLCRKSTSEWVQRNCYLALAVIGAQKSGEFLYATLEATRDQEKRYVLLDFLAQMQYEAALPRTGEILKLDPKEYYWQSIFIFGKMGDKAVPFLIEKINDPDRNVRVNAINVVGAWLLAKESAQPLRERFWKEKAPEMRLLILSALERVTDDPRKVKEFSKKILEKEKEESVRKYARETIDHFDNKLKEDLEAFRRKKRISPAVFAGQYDRIYKSAGKQGFYEIISAASSWEDEPKLKKLRERVLQRNSDECFYDYEKINDIIMFNRLMRNQ